MGRRVRVLLLCLVLSGALVLYSGRSAPVFADGGDGMLKHGPAATATIDRYTVHKLSGWGCSIVGYWGVDSTGADWLIADHECRTGTFQDDTYVGFLASDGQGCTFSLASINVDSTSQRSGSGPWSGGGVKGCGPITELCVDDGGLIGPDWPPPATAKCVPWALGAPPTLTATPTTRTGGAGCAGLSFGQPTATTPLEAQTPDVANPGNYTYTYSMKYTWDIGVDSAHPLNNFILYLVFRSGMGWKDASTGTQYSTWDPVAPAGPDSGKTVHIYTKRVSTARGSVSLVSVTPNYHGTGSGTDQLPEMLVGAGVSYRPGGAVLAELDNGLTSPYADGKYGGYNDPATCTFYWGEKLVNNANATTDDPAEGIASADIPTTPDQPPTVTWNVTGDCTTGATCVYTPDDPGFGTTQETTPPDDQPDDGGSCGGGLKLWNPLTWASAGLCGVVAAVMAVVKVLGKALDALGNLLAAVAGLIGDLLDLLKELFIPDAGSWDFGGLNAEVSARAPFSWARSLADSVGAVGTAYGGAGATGCGGLDTIAQGGGTCSVPPALSAAKSVVSVLLLALTGWYVFTLIGSAVKQ